MVDPLSVTIGVGLAVALGTAVLGIYLFGYVKAREPEHIVDMQEVANYQRHKQSAEALRQDVDE